MHTYSTKTVYLIIYIVSSIVAILFLYINTAFKREAYIQRISDDLKTKYEAAMETFQVHADNFYYEHEDTIAETLYQIRMGEVDQALARKKLYDRFVVYYENQKLFGWRQLHLHLPDAVSFLRYHAVENYGDSLLDLRYSLRRINQDHRFRRGYEIGRYYDGFRYIYPLFFAGEYVGSMEWGQSFTSLTAMMNKTFGDEYYFIVDKALMERKVTPEYLAKYYRATAVHPHFNVFKTQEMRKSHLESLQKALVNEHAVIEKLHTNTGITKTLNMFGKTYIAVMLPVQEIEGNPAGYLVMFKSDETLKTFNTDLFIKAILSLMLIGLIILYLYRSFNEKSTLKTLLDMQKEMVIMTSGDNMIAANRALLNFFGYRSFKQFKKVHDCICDLFIKEQGYLEKTVEGLSWIEFLQNHPDINHFAKIMNPSSGQVETFLVQMNTVYESKNFIVSFVNVTTMDEKAKKLEAKATTDPLTGLYNRYKMHELFDIELKRYKRFNKSLCLTIFDIDHFKYVNDTYGHDIGDDILVELSDCVRGHIRETDFFFRWGGEEFAILQPDTELDVAADVAQRLCDSIAKRRFTNNLQITCSFGISKFSPEDTRQSFFKKADDALYKAKASGRNCIKVYR